MGTWYYEVVSIDGDYANLRRTDIPSEDLKLVARALLPAEIMEGSRLKYELMISHYAGWEKQIVFGNSLQTP